MESVVVAVCTRGRPASLARLLASLVAHAPQARVLVIDNDPHGSARPTVEAAVGAVSHIHEPRVGIPQARNAAFDAADPQAAIAFVDDDETVEPGWLAALTAMRHATGAALVTGPVRPAYDDAVPEWVRRGGFFERRTHSDRAELPFAATNNLLMGPEVRAAGLRFDERPALADGSDALLILQARHRGFRIVWAADAVVTEHVPAERARAGWLCRRAYRVGVTLGALAATEPAADDPPRPRGDVGRAGPGGPGGGGVLDGVAGPGRRRGGAAARLPRRRWAGGPYRAPVRGVRTFPLRRREHGAVSTVATGGGSRQRVAGRHAYPSVLAAGRPVAHAGTALAVPDSCQPDPRTCAMSPASYRLSHLDALESEAVHVMREVAAERERPVLLFSGGKDSAVLLRLAEKAFRPGRFPFPVMHVDTGHNFPEALDFRDRRMAELGERLVVASVQASIDAGRVAEESGARASRNQLQTVTLLDAIAEHGFDALFGGARRDEERSRAKERVVSHRDEFGQWDPKNQRPELWTLYNCRLARGEHLRVFPLSNWTELDVWQYVAREDLELPAIYFAHDREVFSRDGMLYAVSDVVPLVAGEEAFTARVRFRTVGDMSCTAAITSEASTLKEVIAETAGTTVSERGATRADDRVSEAAMEDRKRLGYF